ncbi:ATPase family AAA domain-containing protein 5 [Holothuria leucospilota]|uniref:ATPase family AAA domain-containing protein 5 n=1 Tax=Holothuria leucospilota TaxID=206669 RepID=A0A9Q1H9M7_HOLLE|nr:ATPase family AAA domain-containing protein 5 [Holothuria leucospilota]
MLGIMEDLPAPHQDAGDLPSKTKPSKAKKVPNNGSTITDFFKSPPKPAVPKPVNLFGYFQQKSSPNDDQQLPHKPTDHGKKSDTAAKKSDLGRETPKAAKSHSKEQKQKKKRKSDTKQGDDLEAADVHERASSQCDGKSSQKKKANTERSSKGKRKKAASPGSSTDDFETPPKKAKRPKIASKKTVVSKKVFSLSSGDDNSVLVEASYDVATLNEEEEVPVEGKDMGGESVSGEKVDEVRDNDTVKKSKPERNKGDVAAGDNVQTPEKDRSPEQKVEMISYEDFLNSSMEDLEDIETEKDGKISGGRTEVGTDRLEDDVLLLESAGEDSVMIIAPGKTESYGSHKEDISTRNSLFGKKGGREEDVNDVTDDIKPLEEDSETSCNKIEDLKKEPGDSKDEDIHQKGKALKEDGNVGNAPKEGNTAKEGPVTYTSQEGPGTNKSKEDPVVNTSEEDPVPNTSEGDPVASASKEGLVTNASKDGPVVTETPSKPSQSVVDQSPKIVTVEAVIHSPQSGQKCSETVSKEASCPAKVRVSNVALDDTDNDISIIEVVKSPVKPLYSIFLKKPKVAKTSENAEKAKERKEADDESDAFDETPAKKKGKTRESRQDSVKKDRPRRTPKRKSTAEKDLMKEPSAERTTPRSNQKANSKGKETSDGKKRGIQVQKSEKGNKSVLDASSSKEVGGRTLRARRSTTKMKEVSSDEDDNEEQKVRKGGGGGRRMKNNSMDTTEGKGKKGKTKELLASSNNSKIVQKKNSQSAKAQLLLKRAKGQKVPSSQGQRLQERTRKPTLRLKLDPVTVSLKPIKVIDLDDERKKEDTEENKSHEKNKSIKGSEKATKKAPAKLAPMFTKEGLKSLAKKQQEETGEVMEVHTLSSDDEHSKANESATSPFTVLVASKKWKEKTKMEELPVPPFPEISHVQQRENYQSGLDVWNLSRIESSKLKLVKNFPYQWFLSDLSGMDKLHGRITMSHLQGFVMPQIKFETHPELTYENQKAVLEEISKCNPKFPVRRIFKRYLAKRKGEKTEELKKKDEQTGKNKSEHTGRKRKTEHQDDGAERKVRRRSLRARSVKEQPKTPDVDTTVKETTEDKTSECPRPKDLLWCDKYQPTSSEEVLGNTSSVKKLAGWLSEWKTKIHRLKKKEAKALKGSSGEPNEDSESDFEPSDEGGSDSEDDGDGLCNTILITGPHGVGKTSMVYACAKEMGFKVIEVNASSKRVGRQILDDLGEATQSHQLTGQAGVKSANLAQFFKVKSPSAASSKPQPKPPKPKIHKAFAAFVKAGAKKSDSENMKSPQQKKTSPQKTASKRPTKKVSPKKGKASPKKVQGSPKRVAAKIKSPANGKKASQVAKLAAPDKGKSGVSGASLILFDEVDIIFDEDKGFLNAVSTFMAGAKRPIILTTSDTHFGDNLEGKFEHIVLRRPDTPRLVTNMQLLCLAENVNTNYQDMANLVSYCGNDVRQCLHNLQFWLNSGAMLSSWQHKVKASPSQKVCKLSLKRLKAGEGYSCSVKSENANVESNEVTGLSLAEQTVLPTQHKECFQSMMGSGTSEQLDVLFKSKNGESAPTQDVLPYALIRKFMRGGADHLRRLEEDILHKIIEDYPMELQSQNAVKKDSREPGNENAQIKELCAKSLDHFHSYLDNLCDVDILEQKTNLQSDNTIQEHDGRWWGAEVSAALGDTSDGKMSNWSREEFNADVRSVLEWVNFQKCRRNLTKVGKEWKDIEQSQIESLDTDTEKIAENAEVKGQQPSELLRTDAFSSSDITLLYGVISRKLPRWTRCRPHVVSMDYLPSIRLMCRSEQLREAAHLKRRFLHYFDSISFNLKRTDQVQLASITENFVKRIVTPVSLEPTENESDSE